MPMRMGLSANAFTSFTTVAREKPALPSSITVAATSGHDFLFVDSQHAAFSIETVGHIAQAALGCGVATIVRVPRYDDPDIARHLDIGASGIVVADVANAEEARRVVEACRFPPLGRRSVQSTYSVTRYRSATFFPRSSGRRWSPA